jgi:hypothetical protein
MPAAKAKIITSSPRVGASPATTPGGADSPGKVVQLRAVATRSTSPTRAIWRAMPCAPCRTRLTT